MHNLKEGKNRGNREQITDGEKNRSCYPLRTQRKNDITLSRVNSLPLHGNAAKALSEASTSGEGALPPQDLTLSSRYYQ